MKSPLRSFTRGSSRIGLLSDIAMVGGAALKVLQRQRGSSPVRSVAPAQWLLIAGAAFRLLRRIREVRRRRTRGAVSAASNG